MANITRRITQTFREVLDWLGPTRARILFFLLAFTGLTSLILNAVIANAKGQNVQWATITQTLLVIIFLLGTLIVILSRARGEDRRQILVVLAPAIMAIAIGLFNTSLLPIFGTAGIGWVFLALIVLRGRTRSEYQDAIRFLRKGQYSDAVKKMNELIEREPNRAEHYRFRAELFRLWGKIKRARADYEKVIELDPQSGVGYNGLAEVYLQDGEFQPALTYAQKALEREPNNWVAPYNLGMIEDRLSLWSDSAAHLQQAIKIGIPDSRHRLLTHLWIARAYAHSGGDAGPEITAMKREQEGLKEWKTIFENEAATVLRNVLEGDVQIAEQLLDGTITADALK